MLSSCSSVRWSVSPSSACPHVRFLSHQSNLIKIWMAYSINPGTRSFNNPKISPCRLITSTMIFARGPRAQFLSLAYQFLSTNLLLIDENTAFFAQTITMTGNNRKLSFTCDLQIKIWRVNYLVPGTPQFWSCSKIIPLPLGTSTTDSSAHEFAFAFLFLNLPNPFFLVSSSVKTHWPSGARRHLFIYIFLEDQISLELIIFKIAIPQKIRSPNGFWI